MPSFLALALPSRSIPTFCELLLTSMIIAKSFVTQSWLQGRLHNFWGSFGELWGSYHKWLEAGRWQSYQVVARFMQLRNSRNLWRKAYERTGSTAPGIQGKNALLRANTHCLLQKLFVPSQNS